MYADKYGNAWPQAITQDDADAMGQMAQAIRTASKRTCIECGRNFDLHDEQDAQEWYYGHDCEVEDADTLNERFPPSQPCNDFAPDTLGENPEVCIACLHHRIDHAMAAGGIGVPRTVNITPVWARDLLSIVNENLLD